jgi:hypothetical protein
MGRRRFLAIRQSQRGAKQGDIRATAGALGETFGIALDHLMKRGHA